MEPSQQTGLQQPGFWITVVGFRIPLAGFRIPKPWIPDSADQNYLDSEFRITLHGATFRKVPFRTVSQSTISFRFVSQSTVSRFPIVSSVNGVMM